MRTSLAVAAALLLPPFGVHAQVPNGDVSVRLSTSATWSITVPTTASFTVSAAPDLSVSISRSSDRILPGETRNLIVVVGAGSGVFHEVRLNLQATGGATIAAIAPPAGFSCSDAVCTAPI